MEPFNVMHYKCKVDLHLEIQDQYLMKQPVNRTKNVGCC